MNLEQEFARRLAAIHGLDNPNTDGRNPQENALDVRHVEFQAMADAFLGGSFDRRKLEQVENLQIALHEQQTILYQRYEAEELSPEAYVESFNLLLTDTFVQCEDILGQETFLTLFGAPCSELAGFIDTATFLQAHQTRTSQGRLAEQRPASSPPAEPSGGLRQLLAHLAMQEPTDEVLGRVREALSQPAADPSLDLGGDEGDTLVQSWSKAIRHSLTMEVPCVHVLCGFSAVLDTVYQLDAHGSEAKMFVAWVASQVGLSMDALLDRALKVAENHVCRVEFHQERPEIIRRCTIDHLTQGEGQAFDLIDVVTLLLWCMQNGGRKPFLRTPDLQKSLEAYLTWRLQQLPAPNIIGLLGGAAGNMCHILRELDLNVSAHWLYHPEPLARASLYCLKRVVVSKGVAQHFTQEKSARQKEIYFDGQHQMHEHPVRRNTSFEFPQGMPILNSSNTAMKRAVRQDRVIYRTSFYRNSDRGWKTIVLRVPVFGGGTTDLVLDAVEHEKLLGDNGWPFMPLFCSWHIDMDRLVIEVADDVVMQQLAEQCDYFILTALQGLGDPILHVPLQVGVTSRGRGPYLGSVVKDHLIRQLRVLADNGVVIHTEIPAPSSELFAEMAEVIVQGRIRSVGIGDDDLFTVTGTNEFRGTRFFYANLNPAESNRQTRYLATFRRYQRADYLAKQLTVDQLYVHGTDVDIITRKGATRGAIWREIDALLLAKVAVVLALLKRAGAINQVDSISPVPTVDGFRGLVEFARGFAQHTYPDQEASRRQLFMQILEGKYVFERNPDAYSVLVVPVLWPDPSPEIVTVGAGDMTSSVVAIFAGT